MDRSEYESCNISVAIADNPAAQCNQDNEVIIHILLQSGELASVTSYEPGTQYYFVGECLIADTHYSGPSHDIRTPWDQGLFGYMYVKCADM